MKKNWALSVDQCQLQALQFLVHLIDLLSILLRCNGFTSIQKAVVVQTGSRLTSSDHDLLFFFFGVSLALGSALDHIRAPITELVITGCHIKSTFHCMSQSDQEKVCCCCKAKEKMTLQNDICFCVFFFICSQLMQHHLLSFFAFPIFFKCQMPVAWLMMSSSATSHLVMRR